MNITSPYEEDKWDESSAAEHPIIAIAMIDCNACTPSRRISVVCIVAVLGNLKAQNRWHQANTLIPENRQSVRLDNSKLQ